MTLFRPHQHYADLAAIPLADLWQRGLRGLLLDLDNTLAHHDVYDIAPDALEWIARAKASGFRLALYSNAVTARITRMAQQLDLPPTPRAYKPVNFGLPGTLRVLGLPAAQVALIGDQLFTDVLAGKLGGLTTILIEPLSRREWAHTRGFRRLEYLCGRREPGAMAVLHDGAPLPPADSQSA